MKNIAVGIDGRDDPDTLYDRWRSQEDERERQLEGGVRDDKTNPADRSGGSPVEHDGDSN